MPLTVSRLALAGCLAALILAASPAGAQPAPDTARAMTLGHEAMDAYGKSDWALALDRFTAAEAAAHSPVFVLYMARCQRRQGDLLGARDRLARSAGEVLPATAPEPWQKARGDAARELSELEGRIPSVIVALRGAPGVEPAVTVDDAPVSAAALRAPLRLNPGPHTLRAVLPGRPPVVAAVRLAEGDAPLKVEMALGAEAEVIVPPPAPVAPPPPAKGSLVPGAVVLGAGAAGLLAGAVTGGLALGAAKDAKVGCTMTATGLACPRGNEPDVNRARTLQTATNALFIGGAVAAAAGVVLVIVRPGGQQPVTARLVPGPGSVLFEGAF
jgi:hypothetical protein